ncbi:DUF538 family protein [Melia azedarach]|uniref:DUF538 family protein n=1 Tax=Melia azedarach TaxID=155640 RepID=A0ACC1YWH6_MELAZ|nr:DUF538 family protein [Melia azedarach]
MAFLSRIFLFFFFFFCSTGSHVACTKTAYEVLQEYDFPVGLLPKGVTGYELDISTVKVIRDDDELEFSVGIASADFAVSNFDESPTCGCGFDCLSLNFNHPLLTSSFASS